MNIEGKRFLLGVFNDENDLIHSAEALRGNGVSIYDIYTPFPVHGLDDLLEIKRSRLPIVCFIAGFIGFLFAIYFQIWTSVLSWPVNVGGKPYNSFPAFIPVAFEITVLFGALITVAAFFFRSKLFPGSKLAIFDQKVTDDKFVLVVEEVDAGLDLTLIEKLFKENGAKELIVKGGSECIEQ